MTAKNQPAEKLVVVATRLDPAEAQGLDRLAHDGDRTVSQEVRRAVKRHLAAEGVSAA